MSLLPNLRRIYTNDFPEQYHELINKLSNSLNINLEVLYNVLNKKVSLGDNIACTVKTIEIEVNSSGEPVNDVSITLDNNLPVYGVQVVSAINLTNLNIYPTSQPFVAYSINQQGKLVINYVSGLQASNKYRLNLIVWN